MRDFVLTDIGQVMITSIILIDLQKTFDTLDHKFFWKRRHALVKTPVTKWFKSCLSSRKFFVSVDAVFSEAGILGSGYLLDSNT